MKIILLTILMVLWTLPSWALDLKKGCSTDTKSTSSTSSLKPGVTGCLFPIADADLDSEIIDSTQCDTVDFRFHDDTSAVSGLKYSIIMCAEAACNAEMTIDQGDELEAADVEVLDLPVSWFKLTEVGDGTLGATTPAVQVQCRGAITLF